MLPVAALVSHLRLHAPDLARRLDGITGLERTGAALRIRSPAGSWSWRELSAARGRLAEEASRAFGEPVTVELREGPPDPERLPFPVLSSKHWNHVAFWAWHGSRWALVAAPKPEYQARWVGAPAPPAAPLDLRGDVPPQGIEHALPSLLDALARAAQAERSYAHLVCPFPGDAQADRLERVLHTAKDWGTPRTPGPILQRYVGRIHYVDPDAPPTGVRIAMGLAKGD
ncbi:hypothetical protein [Deferrisoma palaeochoriense]